MWICIKLKQIQLITIKNTPSLSNNLDKVKLSAERRRALLAQRIFSCILFSGAGCVMMISHQIPGYFSSKFSNIRTEFSGVSARDTQKFDEKIE